MISKYVLRCIAISCGLLFCLSVSAQTTNPIQDQVGVTAQVVSGASPTQPSGNTSSSGSVAHFFFFQCNDGIDNDGDGFVDFGSDPDCLSNFGASEGLPSIFVGPFPTPVVYPSLPEYTDNIFPVTATPQPGIIAPVNTETVPAQIKPPLQPNITTERPVFGHPQADSGTIVFAESNLLCWVVWLFAVLQVLYVFPVFKKDQWFGYYGIRRKLPRVPLWNRNLEWGPFTIYFVIGVCIFTIFLPIVLHVYVMCVVPVFVVTALLSVALYLWRNTRKSDH